MRKVALRLGELADDSHWSIRPEPLKKLLRREIGIDDLTEADLQYEVSQKGRRNRTRARRSTFALPNTSPAGYDSGPFPT